MADEKKDAETPEEPGTDAKKPKDDSKNPAEPEATEDAVKAEAADTVAPESVKEETIEEDPMSDTTNKGTELFRGNKDIWLRGLWMIILAILFGIAETILAAAAVLQFFWMLFAKEKNVHIAEFGKNLSSWMAKTALFQTGATEEKPFPWSDWKS